VVFRKRPLRVWRGWDGFDIVAVASAADSDLGLALPPAPESAALDALPGRSLIKKTIIHPISRLVRYFHDPFIQRCVFVRYHLAAIPQVEGAQWRLSVGGEAAESAL
jgi:hypothetical protein